MIEIFVNELSNRTGYLRLFEQELNKNLSLLAPKLNGNIHFNLPSSVRICPYLQSLCYQQTTIKLCIKIEVETSYISLENDEVQPEEIELISSKDTILSKVLVVLICIDKYDGDTENASKLPDLSLTYINKKNI